MQQTADAGLVSVLKENTNFIVHIVNPCYHCFLTIDANCIVVLDMRVL
jgi:hypothetical protein